jgi:hypothetical protein
MRGGAGLAAGTARALLQVVWGFGTLRLENVNTEIKDGITVTELTIDVTPPK